MDAVSSDDVYFQQGNKITDEEAYNNFIELFDYTEKDASEAVYGSEVA